METIVPTTEHQEHQEVSQVPAKRRKRKQTTEDKRKRNYIAVRKHRQQLKDTLENCPVELVKLKKRAQYLDMLLSIKQKMLDDCKKYAKLVEERKELPEEELKKLTIVEKLKSPLPETPSPSTLSTITTSTAPVVPERRKSTTSPIQEKRRRTTTPVSLPPTSMPQMLIPPLFSFPLQTESFQLPIIADMSSFLLPEPPVPMPQLPLSPLISPLYPPPNLLNFAFPFNQQISFPTTQVGPSTPPEMTQETVEALWRLCNQGLNS